MSRQLSSLVEIAVQVFYFTAVFVGIALYVRPEFFKEVVIPYKSTPSLAGGNHNIMGDLSSGTAMSTRYATFYEDIQTKINAFDPYVAFIPTTDENKQRSELPLVFISREEEYLKAKAIEFCLENYHLLAITDITTLQSSCIGTVLNTLLSRISEGKIFTFQEVLERAKMKENEEKQQEQELSPPLTDHLNEGTTIGVKDIYRLAGTKNSYTVRLRLDGGKFYDISFDLLTTSPKKISEYFCAQKANELRVTTDNMFLECVERVEDFILGKLKEIKAEFPQPVVATPVSDASNSEKEQQQT